MWGFVIYRQVDYWYVSSNREWYGFCRPNIGKLKEWWRPDVHLSDAKPVSWHLRGRDFFTRVQDRIDCTSG